MSNRRSRRNNAVSDFFDGFNQAYDTVGRVTRDYEMRRVAEADPELVESKIQPDAAPAVTMQQTAIQGREAKEAGRIPTEKDSAATGLVEAPGVRLAAMEPVDAGSITVGPQLGKISMRHTLAGRDVNPGDKAGVERARELAMIDVVGKTDPMTANRMRRDVTSREREDKRFMREEARADRDDAKAKQEAADQAWLRDFGGAIARRDPQAIADFYNKQYGDGLTAQIVPGQNGSFGVVRVGKDGKPVDKTEFANVDQFISSAVPSLLATRDPLKSMALQRDNEDRADRRARDADEKAHRERTTTSSEKFQAAQIANMEAQRRLQERGLEIQAEAARAKAKAGEKQAVDPEANLKDRRDALSDFDKLLPPIPEDGDATVRGARTQLLAQADSIFQQNAEAGMTLTAPQIKAAMAQAADPAKRQTIRNTDTGQMFEAVIVNGRPVIVGRVRGQQSAGAGMAAATQAPAQVAASKAPAAPEPSMRERLASTSGKDTAMQEIMGSKAPAIERAIQAQQQARQLLRGAAASGDPKSLALYAKQEQETRLALEQLVAGVPLQAREKALALANQ